MTFAAILPLAVAYCAGFIGALFLLESMARRKYRQRLRRNHIQLLQRRRERLWPGSETLREHSEMNKSGNRRVSPLSVSYLSLTEK